MELVQIFGERILKIIIDSNIGFRTYQMQGEDFRKQSSKELKKRLIKEALQVLTDLHLF